MTTTAAPPAAALPRSLRRAAGEEEDDHRRRVVVVVVRRRRPAARRETTRRRRRRRRGPPSTAPSAGRTTAAATATAARAVLVLAAAVVVVAVPHRPPGVGPAFSRGGAAAAAAAPAADPRDEAVAGLRPDRRDSEARSGLFWGRSVRRGLEGEEGDGDDGDDGVGDDDGEEGGGDENGDEEEEEGGDEDGDGDEEEEDGGGEESEDDGDECDGDECDDDDADDDEADDDDDDEAEEEGEEEIIYIDDDDDDFYSYQEDWTPELKSLFPLTARDVAGFLCCSMGLVLAAGGGIGGGGILVPVYILVMDFKPKSAIPLSAVTVLGGACANAILNSRKRHPLADRPLVDWDLILVMEPLTLVGALAGATLNKVVPEKIVVVMLVLLLSVTAHGTLKKAKKMHDAETVYIQRLKRARSDAQLRAASGATGPLPPAGTAAGVGVGIDDATTFRKLRIRILNPDFVSLRSSIVEEEKVSPRNKILSICAMFAVVLFMNVMKGGGAFKSPLGIRCGSVQFWVMNCVMIAFLLAFAWMARTYLVFRHDIKEMVSFDYAQGDIRWDGRATLVYPAICAVAGLCAGMFGIGGGIVKGPLMLGMGVHPSVASATSACMILFTSVAAVTSYVIFGMLLKDYAVACYLLGFGATLFGQIVMSKAMRAENGGGAKRFERNSYIAYSIGGVVLLSALLMTIQSLASIADAEGSDEETADKMKNGICSVEF